MKDGHLLQVNSTFRETLYNARKIGSGNTPNHGSISKRNSLIDYVPGGGSGEYTGGFRLVDMSETVKEKDEEGNEIEKVIPKLGVFGINTEKYPSGYLYYIIGNKEHWIYGKTDIALDDLENATTYNVYAYVDGYAILRILVLQQDTPPGEKEGPITLYRLIGKFKLNKNGVIEDILQIHHGSHITFEYMQPYLAKISLNQEDNSPLNGYSAQLYRMGGKGSPEYVANGRVFLSEIGAYVGGLAKTEAWITVNPVVVQVLDVLISED